MLNLNILGLGCMQNIWLRMSTGLLACGLGLVAKGS
jgi:hypothetical protein